MLVGAEGDGLSCFLPDPTPPKKKLEACKDREILVTIHINFLRAKESDTSFSLGKRSYTVKETVVAFLDLNIS